MDLKFEDKVFLVSGGARGIGQAISEAIAEEGGTAVIIDPSHAEGKQIIEKLKARGSKAYHIPRKLISARDCHEAVMEVIQGFGRIDGIVNNAGKNDGVGLEHGNPQAFLESLQQNLSHYYNLVHYALPYLKDSQGAIVNISSKTAITGQGNTSGYAAAKGAQLALTREWAVELLPYQIRVNAILPAEVYTPLYESWINTFEAPDKKLAEIKARIPLGNRFTLAEEIASMAVFLLSAKASHITGQHLFVDGGYTHLDRATAVLR